MFHIFVYESSDKTNDNHRYNYAILFLYDKPRYSYSIPLYIIVSVHVSHCFPPGVLIFHHLIHYVLSSGSTSLQPGYIVYMLITRVIGHNSSFRLSCLCKRFNKTHTYSLLLSVIQQLCNYDWSKEGC